MVVIMRFYGVLQVLVVVLQNGGCIDCLHEVLVVVVFCYIGFAVVHCLFALFYPVLFCLALVSAASPHHLTAKTRRPGGPLRRRLHWEHHGEQFGERLPRPRSARNARRELGGGQMPKGVLEKVGLFVLFLVFMDCFMGCFHKSDGVGVSVF